MSEGISRRLIRKDCPSSNKISPSASVAKANRYNKIDSNCIPCRITGMVNSGMRPKDAEDSSP